MGLEKLFSKPDTSDDTQEFPELVTYAEAVALRPTIAQTHKKDFDGKCSFCGELYKYRVMIALENPILMLQACDCDKSVSFREERDKKYREEQQLKKEFEERQELKLRLKKSGIGQRLMQCGFDNFTVSDEMQNNAIITAKKYVDNFLDYAQIGQGLYFEGNCGTGKTHIATSISLDIIHNLKKQVIQKTSIELLADIKKLFNSYEKIDAESQIETYKKVALLVIDDLGKELTTEWSIATLFDIIDARVQNAKPIIVTTNYSAQDLIQRLTPKNADNITSTAIVSRLHEVCTVVSMMGEDFRFKTF